MAKWRIPRTALALVAAATPLTGSIAHVTDTGELMLGDGATVGGLRFKPIDHFYTTSGTGRLTMLGFEAAPSGASKGELSTYLGYRAGKGVAPNNSGSGLDRAIGVVAVGAGAMETGGFISDYATAVGHDSFGDAAQGYCSVGVGLRTLYNVGKTATTGTQGAYITAVGCDAGLGATQLRNSTLIGSKCGYSVDSGTTPLNAGVGSTGDGVTAVGAGAVYNLSTSSFICAFGSEAMGAGVLTTNVANAFGFRALKNISSGTADAFGYQSGTAVTTGTGHAFFGQDTGASVTTQLGNSFFGNGSGQACVASFSAAFGYLSLNKATAANTAFGANSGKEVTSGSGHTLVGRNAMAAATTAIRNTVIGEDAYSGSTNYSTCIVVGWNAQPTANNQITLGDASITELRCQQTTITALSDQRYKENIEAAPDALGLDLLRQLPVRTFTWKQGKNTPSDERQQLGMIAQEWDTVLTEAGADWMGVISKNNPDRWEAAPHKLFFSAVMSIQQIAALMDGHDERIAALEARVAELESKAA